jgi:hypothetical protein
MTLTNPSPKKFPRWPLLLFPLAAFIVIWPLLRNGCSCGHDFDFHLLNWIEVVEHWRAGVLYPHWAHQVAWGAGEPLFVFYPPLSWLLGGLLGAVADLSPHLWQSVPIAYSFLVLTAAGFVAYALARTRTAQTSAILAAVLYVVNPYMLFVVYERTAYGELLAAVWLPLLLRALLADEICILSIAAPVALLWLSNAPAAVMGCYTLVAIAFIRIAFLWRASRNFSLCIHFAAKIIAGLGLGFALAAFYIVPAWYEQRWVQIENALVPGLNPSENFLFGHTADPDHDAVLRTASWVALLIILLTIALLITAWQRNKNSQHKNSRNQLILLAALTLAIIFLLIPVSLPLWHLLPQLAYLQFPWRFIAILSTVMILAFASVLSFEKPRWLLLALALPLIAVPISYRVFQQNCDSDDEAAIEMQGGGTAGNLMLVDPIDEYTPRDADEPQLHPTEHQYWLATSLDGDPKSSPLNQISELYDGIEDMRFQSNLATPQMLVLRVWDYPAWRVTINGRVLDQRPQRDDGLMVFPLPAGSATVSVQYARTLDRTIGQSISAVAICAALILWRKRRLNVSSKL